MPATNERVEPSPPAYGVHTEEVWIPMPDGVRLAANLFLPDGAKPGERFPALLEYLPYRKDDAMLARDYGLHSYFAKRGYVGARVDIRGTGRSEGATPDREYSEQEQLDGMEVIAWLARQAWCNGRVGMFGISWGGFNSIHMAMRRPPALKAILAVDATDDLFQDDVHYIDGLLHFDAYMLGIDNDNAVTRPPDFPTDEASLAARFDNPPWSLLYLRQQRDGPFWKRASLIGRYGTIRVPTMMIGGWLDGYRDSVPRMLESLRVPVKAILGPWNHTFPHNAEPGPCMEWRHEAVRWWDRWLKDRDTGILEEPPLAVYVRRSHRPGLDLRTVPGEWRSEAGWPLARARPLVLHLRGGHRLGRTAGPEATHDLRYVPSAGLEAGFWWGDLTPDQAPMDAASLVYDSEPLQADLEILGFPRAHLRASADAPLAHWFVRLSDVAPDGAVGLVAGAGLNGAHRRSARKPQLLTPGKAVDLEVDLHLTSWVFPCGHRIRVAVSNALWPMVWPTPFPMTTTLRLGGPRGCRIELPRIPKARRPAPAFREPEPSDSLPGVSVTGNYWPGVWHLERGEDPRNCRLSWQSETKYAFPWGEEDSFLSITYAVREDDPADAAALGEARTTVRLPGRVLVWRTWISITSEEKRFHYRCRRELREGDRLIRERTWEEDVPRDFQ